MNFTEVEKLITIENFDFDNIKVCNIDFNNSIVETNTTINITQTDKSKLKDIIISKIVELSNRNNEMIKANDEALFNKFSAVDILKEYTDILLKRKLAAKFYNASNYIASNGRVGAANTVLVSQDNYENLNMSEFTQNYDVFLDDSVDDIYIYRKNIKSSNGHIPGLILATFEDKYEVVEIGFFPEKQFTKIALK